jgi:hypothetical protein
MTDIYRSDVVNTVPAFHTFWIPFALTTVRPSVWRLCLHADHSCSCLIADLTQLPRFVCTPSPLVSNFLISLWFFTYHFIHSWYLWHIFSTFFFVEQRIKGNFYPSLSNYLGTWPNFFLIELSFPWWQNSHKEEKWKKSHTMIVSDLNHKNMRSCKRS